jgi:tetratricopeptide (TPR) repeat protein
MLNSFRDTWATEAPLSGQMGRFKSFLEHLVLRCVIATLLALSFSAPMAVLAQTKDQRQTQSDTEALAEAARLNEEVVGLYQAGRAKEALPLAKRALAIREKAPGPEHPDVATSLNNLGFLLQAMGDLKGAKPHYERALQGPSLSRLWCK